MISRGEIYRVDLRPNKGHEQDGVRPVVVVSVDSLNKRDFVVVAVPGTKSANIPADFSTHVRVKATDSGLPEDTVFLCPQIRALDVLRFPNPGKPIGKLSPHHMIEIEKALKAVLGFR